jgi:hypothetical protein
MVRQTREPGVRSSPGHRVNDEQPRRWPFVGWLMRDELGGQGVVPRVDVRPVDHARTIAREDGAGNEPGAELDRRESWWDCVGGVRHSAAQRGARPLRPALTETLHRACTRRSTHDFAS